MSKTGNINQKLQRNNAAHQIEGFFTNLFRGNYIVLFLETNYANECTTSSYSLCLFVNETAVLFFFYHFISLINMNILHFCACLCTVYFNEYGGDDEIDYSMVSMQ